MSSSINSEIATIVLAERQKRGWTQQGLADKAGLSRVAVNYVESGSRTMRMTTIEKIALAFGLALEIRFKEEQA